MSATPSAPPVTPERIFNTINAYQRTDALKAAIDLDVFTAVAEGNTTAAAIAKHCNASERGVRILCDFLTLNGLLSKTGDQYALAPDAALFLSKKSPAYMGGATQFLLTPHLREGFGKFTEAVRKGGSAIGDGTLVPENPDWVQFAQAMRPLAHMPAQLVAAELQKGGPSEKVLDIAASHGLYGIAVAQLNPTAQIYGADWKNVLEAAIQNAQAMGLADRYHPIPGDAFDTTFGIDYDVVLVPNFLHHFDPPTCTTFMRKVHSALKPGGRAAIVEFVPNPDRVTPPTAAAFSMIMLATTPSGDAYTFAELEKISKDAGFTRAELIPQPMGISNLVIAYK